jgi:hypothetical protein
MHQVLALGTLRGILIDVAEAQHISIDELMKAL